MVRLRSSHHTRRHRLLLIVAFTALGGAACGGGGDGNGDDEPGDDDGDDGGEIIEDMEFPAFLGGDTGGDPVAVSLSDYFVESRPGARIIMINAAAGWCAPCMREAEAMPEFAATYEPRGAVILTAVFQDQNGDPADAEFVKAWVDNFDLALPALIDESFQMGAYVDVNVMPVNVFVDAETREILEVAQGAETGDDPMQEYRELLDFYLEQ
ncbi:MAG TPA: TlpA disulfide reductase family protein [Kofleriaceae bacterium]|nr:TlpA disulfide reductase family protein [Kofleriaceae bacterium]